MLKENDRERASEDRFEAPIPPPHLTRRGHLILVPNGCRECRECGCVYIGDDCPDCPRAGEPPPF